jgi:predicted transcriptional regulator YdeE
MDIQTDQAVRVVELGDLHFVGFGVNCPGGDTSGISDVWGSFYGSSVPQSQGAWGVSFCNAETGSAAGFYYLAAHQVPAGTPTPEGMEARSCTAARYAVFPFKGTPPQMSATFQDIFTRRIPEAGLRLLDGGASLERYEPDCWDEATGELTAELYVAVE